MITPVSLTVSACALLCLTDAELRLYWETHVATQYWHGTYLEQATELSKKRCFNRWLKLVKRLADEGS
jgi:hypothetical protein